MINFIIKNVILPIYFALFGVNNELTLSGIKTQSNLSTLIAIKRYIDVTAQSDSEKLKNLHIHDVSKIGFVLRPFLTTTYSLTNLDNIVTMSNTHKHFI